MPGASNICRCSKRSAGTRAVPGSSSWEGKAGNAGTPADESSAVQELVRNAQNMPNFGGVAGDLAGRLLNGTYQVNPNSTVGQSYDALKAQYAPYTGSDSVNPYNNPAFKDYLDTTTRDVANRVNSMFAGAG